jgi:hypothetical protein
LQTRWVRHNFLLLPYYTARRIQHSVLYTLHIQHTQIDKKRETDGIVRRSEKTSHTLCVWWQLFPTSEIAATDKNVCGGKQPNFYGEFVLTFFLNLPGIWDYRERQLKVELLHLDEIKKGRCAVNAKGL